MKVIASDEELINRFGFQYINGNKNDEYLIRYLTKFYDPEDWETYKTVYVDRKTRRIFAYNDMYDEEITLNDEYIRDLLRARVIRKDN